MSIKTITQAQSNSIFKSKVMALGDAVKEILKSNDVQSLKGIQAFSGFMSMNAALNNGAGVLAYLVKETMKTYNPKNPMPKVLFRKIIDAFPGFSEHKIKEVLNGFANYGFVEFVFDEGLSPEFKNLQHPSYTRIKLTSLWDRYLKQYKLKSKETELFVESIGRLIWASILANDQEPSGVRSFKVLVIILENVTSKGEISKQEIENFCSKMGEGRFAQLLGCDNIKIEGIRFFEKIDGDKVKVNGDTLICYHKYVVPISERILRSFGLTF